MTAPGGSGGPGGGDARPRSRLFRAAPEALFVDEEVPSIRMPAPPATPLEEDADAALDEDGLLTALAADDTEDEPIRAGPARIYVGAGVQAATPSPPPEPEDIAVPGFDNDIAVSGFDDELDGGLGSPIVEITDEEEPDTPEGVQIRERRPMVVPPPRAVAAGAGVGDQALQPPIEDDAEAEDALWAGLARPARASIAAGGAPWAGEGEAPGAGTPRGFVAPPIRHEPVSRGPTSRLFVRGIIVAGALALFLVSLWIYRAVRVSGDTEAVTPVDAARTVDLTGASPFPPAVQEPSPEAEPTPTPPAEEVTTPAPSEAPQAEARPATPRERTGAGRPATPRATTPDRSESPERTGLWDTTPPPGPPTPVTPAVTSPVTPVGTSTAPSPITLPAVANGRITIESDQYAVIFMSGRRLGMTPIVDMEVPSGTYTLRATARDSGISQTIMVEVRAGETRAARFTFQE